MYMVPIDPSKILKSFLNTSQQVPLALSARTVSQVVGGVVVGSEDLLDRYDEDDAVEHYYSMRLRHALPTAQGIFEAFEGRWVYALGRDPHAPFGIGDAPIF